VDILITLIWITYWGIGFTLEAIRSKSLNNTPVISENFITEKDHQLVFSTIKQFLINNNWKELLQNETELIYLYQPIILTTSPEQVSKVIRIIRNEKQYSISMHFIDEKSIEKIRFTRIFWFDIIEKLYAELGIKMDSNKMKEIYNSNSVNSAIFYYVKNLLVYIFGVVLVSSMLMVDKNYYLLIIPAMMLFIILKEFLTKIYNLKKEMR